MTNKKLGIILAILVLIIIALSWYLLHPQEVQEDVIVEATPTQLCQEDIASAQESTADQICTSEFREMTCPYDEAIVHGAPNGCVISALTAEGWVSPILIEEVEIMDNASDPGTF